MKLALVHFSPEVYAAYADRADTVIGTAAQDTAGRLVELGLRGVANEWLLSQRWKRALALLIYGDLLDAAAARSIVEIGPGLSGLVAVLSARHRYTAIERATHEPADTYARFESDLGRPVFRIADWADCPPIQTDLLIANDLFPNVDQRLYEFTDVHLRGAREVRLSLTYYEHTSFEVTRITSGERLTMRPWGLRDVRRYLEDLVTSCDVTVPPGNWDEVRYEDYAGKLFANRRNVLYVKLTR